MKLSADMSLKSVLPEKTGEFIKLWNEFIDDYYSKPVGTDHHDQYFKNRLEAQENWNKIVEMHINGEDITDLVLLKLLPHVNTKNNRERGAWIHIAPSITKDIKVWYENAGWTKPEEWPLISEAIFLFIESCINHPDELHLACSEFSSKPYSKGFQVGTLTPILNALLPGTYSIINNKSREIINYFTGESFKGAIVEYPSINAITQNLVNELAEKLNLSREEMLDTLDMFSHYVVGVKKYFKKERAVDPLLKLLERKYPNWEGFSDPRFISDEILYKREASNIARKVLSENEFSALLRDHNYDELSNRLKKVAAKTNLLYLSTPTTGDLNVLSDPNLDKPSFFEALYQLFHGAEDIPSRLQTYWDYVQTHDLKNKWTFPTYYLFLLYTQEAVFVKPSVTKWLLSLYDQPPLPATPSASGYLLVQNLFAKITETFAEFQPQDMIDIQSLIWVAYSQSKQDIKLGIPFNQMFRDFDEADWAFNWIQSAMEELGVESADDPMIAVNVRRRDSEFVLRFNYGNWLILGFSGKNKRLNSIDITLLSDKINIPFFYKGDFILNQGIPPLSLYSIEIELIHQFESEINQLFFEGLPFIRQQFMNWSKSNFHDRQNQLAAKSVFDPATRRELLTTGTVVQPPEEETGDTETRGNNHSTQDGYFTARTFELLQGIHENPRKEYYDQYIDEFKKYIENPFKELMTRVANRLPQLIKDRMETQKSILGKFLKNDYGQGGAWDYYWGAFYPKQSKRTADAQLSLWMNKDRLDIGFYIGDYGIEVRERFKRNLQQYSIKLKQYLAPLTWDHSIIIGDEEDGSNQQKLIKTPITWDDWFTNPAINNYDVGITLIKPEILAMSRQELEDKVFHYFTLFYPLVLVSQEDNPILFIEQYLEVEVGEDGEDVQPSYSIEMVAQETGFSTFEIQRWVNAIHRKGQAILYGPPGTGKTYVATQLAKHLVSNQNGFIDIVQFHPAYSYEEFIQGIRPKARPEGGLDYPTVPGRFLEFCREASQRKGICVLIIDEINRANLARVFGELMYLLEYREESIPLAGGGLLRIPSNVRIIGTMNTADRSIALVDHALRRRFAFLPLYPNYEVLQKYHINNQTGFPVDALIDVLKNLNINYIRNPHYEAGISFFLRKDLTETIEDVWRMEIEPYLEEYFFDQLTNANEFKWEKIKDKLTGDRP